MISLQDWEQNKNINSTFLFNNFIESFSQYNKKKISKEE